MIAVDAPVLVELLTDGPRADAVEASLRHSLASGRVVLCDVGLAQLNVGALQRGGELALHQDGRVAALQTRRAIKAVEAGRCPHH